MIVYIYGHSDDLVEVEGPYTFNGEFDGPTAIELGDTDFGGVRVEMDYVSPGVWAATIRQLEEGVPIPWDIHVRHTYSHDGKTPGYSVQVIIDIPNPHAVGMNTFSLEKTDG